MNIQEALNNYRKTIMAYMAFLKQEEIVELLKKDHTLYAYAPEHFRRDFCFARQACFANQMVLYHNAQEIYDSYTQFINTRKSLLNIL